MAGEGLFFLLWLLLGMEPRMLITLGQVFYLQDKLYSSLLKNIFYKSLYLKLGKIVNG